MVRPYNPCVLAGSRLIELRCGSADNVLLFEYHEPGIERTALYRSWSHSEQ